MIDRLIRLALGLASVAAFVHGVAGLVALRVEPSNEHALADARGIAIDVQGNVYCAIPGAQRIQAYGPDGRFRWVARIDPGQGAIRLRAAENGGVEAATARTDLLYRLSRDGDVLSVTTRPDAFHEFGGSDPNSTVGPSGETYLLTSDAILVRSPDGATRTLVQQPWWPYRFRRATFPTAILMALSVAWAGVAVVWGPAFRRDLLQRVIGDRTPTLRSP